MLGAGHGTKKTKKYFGGDDDSFINPTKTHFDKWRDLKTVSR
jgi:hypothetical protein